jgi:outer membrane protein OmpA-like peptidoglycan-associated protein
VRPTFDSYQSNYAEVPQMRRWLLGALAVSLLLHLGMMVAFRFTMLTRFATTSERLVPRTFTVNRVEIDPRLLIEDKAETKTAPEKNLPKQIALPEDRPSATGTPPDEIRVAPIAQEIARPIVSDKPRLDSANLQTLVDAKVSTSKDMERALDAASRDFLKDTPVSPKQPLLKSSADDGEGAATAGAASAAIPGLQSLDDALGGNGGAFDPSKPIGIPGGALFAYDSADLSAGALGELGKLAALIQRFPGATIGIEGHTDSFGTPDYNQALSQRRAESVKIWLVQNFNLPPDTIQTTGYGSSKLRAPASGTVGEQSPNRRVEIVIHARQ